MLAGTCHCARVNWRLDEHPESATACNCTICRRYGALWGYGYLDDNFHVSGQTLTYRRPGRGAIDFHFCSGCGCLCYYVATASQPEDNGRYWSAGNIRMCEPGDVAELALRRFDGLENWTDLPDDNSRVKDLWY